MTRKLPDTLRLVALQEGLPALEQLRPFVGKTTELGAFQRELDVLRTQGWYLRVTWNEEKIELGIDNNDCWYIVVESAGSRMSRRASSSERRGTCSSGRLNARSTSWVDRASAHAPTASAPPSR